jgi:hypothetical protein
MIRQLPLLQPRVSSSMPTWWMMCVSTSAEKSVKASRRTAHPYDGRTYVGTNRIESINLSLARLASNRTSTALYSTVPLLNLTETLAGIRYEKDSFELEIVDRSQGLDVQLGRAIISSY